MARYIVGISGASGTIYGVRLLEALHEAAGDEIHLIITPGAKRTMALEMSRSPESLAPLASFVHSDDDLAAPISSGSFQTAGMVVAPCSIKTAAAIAYSLNDTLLVRAADVCLKERRRLVLLIRETPLHLGHLRTLTQLAELGAVILPPIPGFYSMPKTVDDIVNHSVGKALDALGVSHEIYRRWRGPADQHA
ncbi:MAG: UbiX family flavin prenyltransferase [Candidatus Eremiobacteraeota bacterium]|nr:UbiX family flavin prenyltransferase [Candidatus Eremiobacteraeota bacterium]